MAFDIISPTTGKTPKTYEAMEPGEIDRILDRCHEVPRRASKATPRSLSVYSIREFVNIHSLWVNRL